MGIFGYTIRTQEGKVIKGRLEIESPQKAIDYFHSQGSIVLSIKEIKAKKSEAMLKGKVKVDELVIFSRQLTTLVESGISIVSALEILTEQTTNLYFKRVISSILKDLKEGVSFSSALAKYPQVFSELYVSMVEAAEISGNLPQILERISLYLEKTSALKKKIIASLTYPAIVVMLAIGITSFLIFNIIPTFKGIFDMLGGKLPLPTFILINLADFLKNNILYIIVSLGAIFFLLKKYISTSKGKEVYHKFLLNLPILGEIIRKIAIAKFSRTFSTLVKSGVSIVTALDIVGKTSGNKIVENAVLRAKQAIQEGVPISTPLQESGIFPPMVVKMVAVGEKTGKLEEMLSKIAQFYETQTEAIISGLTSLIEPLVIGFLGIVVGGIVISLFLPIIRVTQLLGGG